MPSPIFDSLIIDLSKQIFDPRSAIGEPDANYDYPEVLLVLALNRGCRDFLTALIEKETVENIVKAVPEYVVEVGLAPAGGIVDMPTDAIKGISIRNVNNKVAIYTPPEKWHALAFGEYNEEEAGTTDNPRWTEFDKQIRMTNSPASINYLYVKTHADLSANGATDISLNQRFHNQLLDLATAYILKLSPVK